MVEDERMLITWENVKNFPVTTSSVIYLIAHSITHASNPVIFIL